MEYRGRGSACGLAPARETVLGLTASQIQSTWLGLRPRARAREIQWAGLLAARGSRFALACLVSPDSNRWLAREFPRDAVRYKSMVTATI